MGDSNGGGGGDALFVGEGRRAAVVVAYGESSTSGSQLARAEGA